VQRDAHDENLQKPDLVVLLFPAIWMLFRLSIWVTVAILWEPRLLSKVGWDAGAHWFHDHGWVRWVAVPVVGPLLLLSVFSFRGIGRATDDESALDDTQSAIDPTLGLRESAVIRWRHDGQVIEAATWSNRGERRCVATATVAVTSGFAFSARTSRLEPSWMSGAAQGAIRKGIDQGRESASGAEAQTWEALAFLGQDPVPLSGSLGRDVVLRTNQPGLARDMFSDPEVDRVIAELEHDRRRWDWSLLPSGRPGEARLRFECRGKLEDPELAAWVETLMSAGVQRLARAGVIAEPARRSAG